jgi:anti-anti-sigma factor
METLAETVGDIRVLHLRGRLDLAAADEFDALLHKVIDDGFTKIILDCRDLQYVSSSGLGAFISGAKKLGPSGTLAFAALNRHVQNVLDLTGIANLFSIYGSKEDALRQLTS